MKKNIFPPYRHIIATLVLVFMAELLIMYFFSILPHLPATTEAFLDASLLSLIVIPILYFFWVRPRIAESSRIVQLEAMQKSEKMIAKLAMVVRQTADAVIITDKDGIIEYVNLAFEEVTGYSSGEMIGKSPAILKSGKHDEKFYKTLWDTILSGEPFRAAFTNKKKNGELYFQEVTITPLTDSGNQTTHFVSTGKDITKSVQADDLLRQSNEKYRSLFEASRDALMVLSPPEWKFTSGNKSAVELFGARDEEEFLVFPPWKLSPEFQPDGEPSSVKAKRMIETAMSRGSHFFEWTHKKITGQDFHATVLLTKLTIKGFPCLQATVRDVTEQKRTEKSLLASEARYRAVAYSANDAIVSANSAGNIVGWNRSAERLFGHTEIEAVGQSLTLIIPPRYRARHLEGINRMRAGGERRIIGSGVELEGLRKDGSEFPLELSLSEWEVPEGRFFTAIIRDITDRKHLEKIALQSEKLSAVGQLAAGVAHEINNPLGVILGFAQSCIKRLQSNDPFELPLKSIEREANRCKILVQELLTFSRSNQDERREEDINKVIEKALTLVEVSAKMNSVELMREFEGNLPRVSVNLSQIQQVVVNLCNNAIDAMPRGGALTLRTRTVRESEKEFVQIQVQDTGPGIPREIQLKVFDPFFTTKEVGKGTGLGLSITHEIIQKHGGTITLESQIGIGTTFTIRIPLSHKMSQ